MFRAALFLLAIATAACAPPGNAAEHVAGARPASLLSSEQRVASSLTVEWLVGYWAFEGRCQLDESTALWPDGTYTMGGGYGRWSLLGAALTIHEEGRPSVDYMQVRLGDPGPSTVRKIGANEIEVRWGTGLESRFVRCN